MGIEVGNEVAGCPSGAVLLRLPQSRVGLNYVSVNL